MPEHIKQAFISDMQIPYQDNRAIALMMKMMKWWKPDAIDILGDVDDQLEYSRFSDGTTDEFFKQIAKEDRELPLPFVKANAKAAADFYADVRKANPNADIFSALGNHDIRIFDYMDKKAPEWVEYITPEYLWGLDNLGIEYIMHDEKPRLRYGGLHSHHGNTISSTGLAVAKDIDKLDISLVRGHSHNAGLVYKTMPLSGRQLVGFEIGHLCDESAYGLKYTFNHTWEKGFGVNHVIDGVPHLYFVHITPDYTAVLDGKIFTG